MKTIKLFSLMLLFCFSNIFYSCVYNTKPTGDNLKEEKSEIQEGIHITKTSGLLNEENAWDKYVNSPAASPEKKTIMQIDSINNDDLKDSFKHGGVVAEGKEIYTGKEGWIETFLVIIPDHLLYEYLISYDTAGNFVDCIEINRIGQDMTQVTIEGNTILCESEWWDSGEGGKVSRQYTITPELKFYKEKEWEESLTAE